MHPKYIHLDFKKINPGMWTQSDMYVLCSYASGQYIWWMGTIRLTRLPKADLPTFNNIYTDITMIRKRLYKNLKSKCVYTLRLK